MTLKDPEDFNMQRGGEALRPEHFKTPAGYKK
jgi:hypothetical protein